MTAIQTLLERAERALPANPAVVPVFGDPPLAWAQISVETRRAACRVGDPCVDARLAWGASLGLVR